MLKTKNSGYTLIELTIVVVVLVIGYFVYSSYSAEQAGDTDLKESDSNLSLIFPVELTDYFSKLGIAVNKYAVDLTETNIELNGDSVYIDKWNQYAEENPKSSKEDLLNYFEKLMLQKEVSDVLIFYDIKTDGTTGETMVITNNKYYWFVDKSGQFLYNFILNGQFYYVFLIILLLMIFGMFSFYNAAFSYFLIINAEVGLFHFSYLWGGSTSFLVAIILIITFPFFIPRQNLEKSKETEL